MVPNMPPAIPSSSPKPSSHYTQRPRTEGLLVLDYGSQYTLLIARRLRELGAYSEIIHGHNGQRPEGFHIKGVILSGGPDSVNEEGSRKIPEWVLQEKVPVLGICYGMQLIVEAFGGSVRSTTKREYGKESLHSSATLSGHKNNFGTMFFKGTPQEQTVWMSHGDDMKSLPEGFDVLALTGDEVTAAIAHKTRPIIGLQYHPEVTHSEFGAKMLQNFAQEICRLTLDWKQSSRIESLCSYILDVSGEAQVLSACSGGVDSTVTTALLLKALGADRVTAVFCDTGLLRKNEVPWVAENLKHLGLKRLDVIDAKTRFLQNLKGVTDPEEKRKTIGRLFIEEFEAYAKPHKEFTHLAQGTLYPDVIESAGHGAGSKVIKSHHNVGGLPDKLALKLVEPLRWLFKDEVRQIGLELGLPAHLIDRHPFPGPGLAVRILGEVTQARVDILQHADDVFISMLREYGLYNQAWQAFAVLLPVKSVGVMGDNRTYQETIALRAVTSIDGMTAEVAKLPFDFLTAASDQIIRKVSGVNRVVFDLTSKPPGTIEWE
jgi:GMP synthase (glutamine-hydrolysing)